MERLDAALVRLGSRLVIRRAATSDDVAGVLAAVAAEAGATTVHTLKSFDPYCAEVDARVGDTLAAARVRASLPFVCCRCSPSVPLPGAARTPSPRLMRLCVRCRMRMRCMAHRVCLRVHLRFETMARAPVCLCNSSLFYIRVLSGCVCVCMLACLHLLACVRWREVVNLVSSPLRLRLRLCLCLCVCAQVAFVQHAGGSLLVNPEGVRARGPGDYAATFSIFSSAISLPSVVPLPAPAAVPPPRAWPASEVRARATCIFAVV